MEPTEIQKQIIDEKGNTVVLASPGSGKTFVIAEKIKGILLSDSLKDYQGVIAISYTRKASNNLKRRTDGNGIDLKNSFFGTIDSFCLTQVILRFGDYVIGHPKGDVTTLNIKDLDDNVQESFHWIEKEHPEYELIGADAWQCIYKLYLNQIVLIESVELLALHIIKKCKACRAHLKARFKYVFIDEFQDVDVYSNGILREFLNLGIIANVVGDVNQSIFGFANKTSKYLYALQKDPAFKPFYLTRNFRSSNSIVNYSNRLLNKDAQLLDCDMSDVIMVTVQGGEELVAEYLDSAVPSICAALGIRNLSEVAILVKNKRTQGFISENMGIAHRMIETTVLDTDLNPRSRLFATLLQFYFNPKMSFMEVIEDTVDLDSITKPARKRLTVLKDQIRDISDDELNMLKDVFCNIAEMLLPGYPKGLSETHLADVLGDAHSLNSYRPLTGNEVVIMTLHKAKGLEFDVVFHLNLNEWELPNKRVKDGDFNNPIYPSLEQDLDLHYVGITRARKKCFLVTSTLRTNGEGLTRNSKPSEFLSMNGLAGLRTNQVYYGVMTTP